MPKVEQADADFPLLLMLVFDVVWVKKVTIKQIVFLKKLP
jgi:hypothetical protein